MLTHAFLNFFLEIHVDSQASPSQISSLWSQIQVKSQSLLWLLTGILSSVACQPVCLECIALSKEFIMGNYWVYDHFRKAVKMQSENTHTH